MGGGSAVDITSSSHHDITDLTGAHVLLSNVNGASGYYTMPCMLNTTRVLTATLYYNILGASSGYYEELISSGRVGADGKGDFDKWSAGWDAPLVKVAKGDLTLHKGSRCVIPHTHTAVNA
jgi:hypothetical protein